MRWAYRTHHRRVASRRGAVAHRPGCVGSDEQSAVKVTVGNPYPQADPLCYFWQLPR
jgi:hypothetical protein